MKPDITVSWDDHLKRGDVWAVEVELSMQETPGDFHTYNEGIAYGDFHTYNVEVHVVAPNQALAQYIVATMYPEHEGIFVSDEPYRVTK